MESIKGYVRGKISASDSKNRGLGRPRAHRAEKLIKRAEKKLAAVLKFANEDVAAAMQVLRDQLEATKGIWDVNAKCMVQIPDEKIRQDAALAILAYEWGRPTEKKLVANFDADDFPTLLEKLRQSPAFLEEYPEQKTVEHRPSTPALPEPQ